VGYWGGARTIERGLVSGFRFGSVSEARGGTKKRGVNVGECDFFSLIRSRWRDVGIDDVVLEYFPCQG